MHLVKAPPTTVSFNNCADASIRESSAMVYKSETLNDQEAHPHDSRPPVLSINPRLIHPPIKQESEPIQSFGNEAHPRPRMSQEHMVPFSRDSVNRSVAEHDTDRNDVKLYTFRKYMALKGNCIGERCK
jgi:hypothetical protein